MLSTRTLLQVLKPYKLCQLYTVCPTKSPHTEWMLSALAREMGPLEFNIHCATRWTSSLERSFMGNQRISFPAQHQMVAVGNNKAVSVSPLLTWCPIGSQVEKWLSIHFTLSKGKASGLVPQSKILGRIWDDGPLFLKTGGNPVSTQVIYKLLDQQESCQVNGIRSTSCLYKNVIFDWTQE